MIKDYNLSKIDLVKISFIDFITDYYIESESYFHIYLMAIDKEDVYFTIYDNTHNKRLIDDFVINNLPDTYSELIEYYKVYFSHIEMQYISQ